MVASIDTSTTGPSPRSIATPDTPSRTSRLVIDRNDDASCATLNRSITPPASSITQHTCVSDAQSIPADTAIITLLRVWSLDAFAGRASLLVAHCKALE